MVARRSQGIAVLVFGLLLVLAAAAPAVNPNEREVKPQRNVQDTDDIAAPDSKVWVLDFKFKDPRLIKVDIPGRGQKICWYLWYQVTNYTKEPRTFVPAFELVSYDKNLTPTVHRDQILPRVQEAIRKIEDPTGYYDIKNSVTISANPIPVSRQEAAAKAVTGVAIWDAVDPDANRFSIFVAGLSNGWALTDPVAPETPPVVRRKTLQLNFRRLGDRYYQKSEEIKFVPPAQWIYRGARMTVPGLPGSKEAAPKESPEKAPEKAAEKVGSARQTR